MNKPQMAFRQDPSTGLVHKGCVIGTFERGQTWIKRCTGYSSGIDTVFWTPCLKNEVTCLWCLTMEFT